jgi:Lon protease-like protein
MVADCLDAASSGDGGMNGQLAMAIYERSPLPIDDVEPPVLRPVVCVGQIVQHEQLGTGDHHILVQGICRARIVELGEPDDERLYRLAQLRPLEDVFHEPPPLPGVRERLRDLLGRPYLGHMCAADTVREWIDREDVPTHALLELVGFTMVNDEQVRYELLAEANPRQRAMLIQRELLDLDRLIGKASRQCYRDWPKGLSWN